MNPTCEQYLEDPEAHETHLETCADCRAMFDELDAELIDIPSRPISVDALPIAPWEGAAHRTWPLVLAGAVSVLILAAILFLAAGISPLRGIVRAAASSIPSVEFLMSLSNMAGGALHNAPLAWHITIAVSFIVINTLLFLLLRRSPKGMDV